VLNTKSAVDNGLNEIRVRVDNQAASDNVSHFLTSQGFQVDREAQGQDFIVMGSRDGEAQPAQAEPSGDKGVQADEAPAKICALITTDRIGLGDDELGIKLMASYLATLKEMGPDLWRIILLNGAVKMAIEGAENLKALKELEESGVSILVCGTCLTFFDLLEKKAVGETTNMLDVVTSLQVAGKVISIT
jgi:selenium metabolism protein YedF